VNIDRALRAFDARAFVARHGGYKESPSPSSSEYLLPCPYCSSDRLRWNHPTKQLWICWGCRRTGSTLDLVQALEKLDLLEAMRYVEKLYVGGDASLELTPLVVARPVRSIGDLPAMPWPTGVDVLADVDAHRFAWRYLAKRGVSAATALSYRVGIGRFGRLEKYLVFPCYQDGRLVYWQARATWDPPAQLYPAQRKEWIKENHFRKTLNPVSVGENATAADVLFNYDRACQSQHVVINEGPFDAMQVGPHAVALLGKSASDGKINLLRRMRAARYTVYLDRGEAEAKAAMKLAGELSTYAPTFIATPPEGYDPGALTFEQNNYVIERAVRYDAARARLLGVGL